jgi:hypothetical protein
MQTGESFPAKAAVIQLLERWRANMPGGEEHVAGFDIRKAIPAEFAGKQIIATGDENGTIRESEMHAASSDEMLIVYGKAIYPPARHSLMLLAQDPPMGAAFGLRYENERSGKNDHPIAPEKHYSKITGKELGHLQGALERHMREYAVQDRVSGFLGQMYSSLARRDTPRFKFSEYAFSQSKTDKNGLVLHGTDGMAIIEIIDRLNKTFKNTPDWQRVNLEPVSHRSDDPSNEIVIPVDFFSGDGKRMKQLEELVARIPLHNPLIRQDANNRR